MKPSVVGSSSDALRSSYEDLGAQALAGGHGPGFALCQHRGMREWIEVCSSGTAVVATIEPAEAPTNPQSVPPEMRSEIVSILAGLFLQKRWEAIG